MPRLELEIVGCTGLENVETFGKIDPYCTVMFEGKTWKTEECENTTDPKWNKVFKFNVSDQDSSQAHICVWNKNTISDDFLGDYRLSVSGLDRGKADDRQVLLSRCKGNAELHIIVTAVDFGDVADDDEPSPQTTYQQRPPMAGFAPPAGAAINPGYPPQQPGYPPQQQGMEMQMQQQQQQMQQQMQQQAQQMQQQQQQMQQQMQQQQQQMQQQMQQQQQQMQQQMQEQVHHHHHQQQPSQQQHGGGALGFGLRSAHGTHLQGNGGQVCTSPNMAAWETWTIETRGSQVILRSHDGQHLRGDPQNAVNTSPNAAEWETWTIQPHPSEHGKYAIRSHHNTYLRADAGSNGADLAGSAGAWEAWELVRV